MAENRRATFHTLYYLEMKSLIKATKMLVRYNASTFILAYRMPIFIHLHSILVSILSTKDLFSPIPQILWPTFIYSA